MFQYIGANKSLSMCSPLCPTLCDPMDYSPTRLLCPWNFSRQEYWSHLPFPSPGDLSDPGIKPGLPAFQADSLPLEPPGKPGSCPSGFQIMALEPKAYMRL